MTTIREYCERKEILPYVKEYWRRNKGQVPLCCYETAKTEKGPLMTCTWLNAWYSPDKFAEKCRECQKEIEKLIAEEERCVYTASSDQGGEV